MRPFGSYEIEKELGRGTSGAVFAARHVPTGVHRAIKILEDSSDPEAIARFRREAETLARLGGVGVVVVHETVQENRRIGIVMDLMPGSLRARLKEGKLPWTEAVELGAKLARTLERCHALGLVHRDLKPDNVLFDEQGEPRIADFGSVRDLGASALTQSGALMGTLGYMSPELLDGEKADSRADVWALAALVHEIVNGKRPFPGRTPWDVLKSIKSGERPRLEAEGAPRSLDEVLDRALAFEPAHRTSTAVALAADLESVRGSRAPAPPPTGGGRGGSVVGVALTGVAVGVALVAAVHFGRSEPQWASSPSPASPSSRPSSAAPAEAFAAIVSRLRQLPAKARLPLADLGALAASCRTDRDVEDLAQLVRERGVDGDALPVVRALAHDRAPLAVLELLHAELALASGDAAARPEAARALEQARSSPRTTRDASGLVLQLAAVDALAAALDALTTQDTNLREHVSAVREAARRAIESLPKGEVRTRRVVLAPVTRSLRGILCRFLFFARAPMDELEEALAPLAELVPEEEPCRAALEAVRASGSIYREREKGLPLPAARYLLLVRLARRRADDPTLAATLFARALYDVTTLVREERAQSQEGETLRIAADGAEAARALSDAKSVPEAERDWATSAAVEAWRWTSCLEEEIAVETPHAELRPRTEHGRRALDARAREIALLEKDPAREYEVHELIGIAFFLDDRKEVEARLAEAGPSDRRLARAELARRNGAWTPELARDIDALCDSPEPRVRAEALHIRAFAGGSTDAALQANADLPYWTIFGWRKGDIASELMLHGVK